MRNLKLTLSYDGTDFFGWQTQPEKRTVQETLEKAIAKITGEDRVRVNAAGRGIRPSPGRDAEPAAG